MAVIKRGLWCGVAMMALAWAVLPRPALAAEVEVIDTWPAGDRIELVPEQAYRLRLGYSTDVPVRIWARPYFEGQQVPATTHGSSLHEGSGETSGWFSLARPWQRVDEVRITVNDGSGGSTEVARHRVHIVSDPEAAAAGPEPAWVEENRERDRERARVDSLRRQEDSGGFLSSLVASAFVMAIPVLGILGVVAPVLAFRRWSGPWRLGAALPLVALGVMLLTIIVGVALDPTSNNLWPLTLLLVAMVGLAWLGLLALLRWFLVPAHARRGGR